MVNYLFLFLLNLSEKSTLVHQLLQKVHEWKSDKAQEAAFNSIKDLCSSKCIAKYNPRYIMILATFTSASGLGVVLLQWNGE